MAESDSRGSQRRVAIWKESWLPYSETFVRNQLNAMTAWKPLPVGFHRQPSPVSSESDLVLFGDRLRDRAIRAAVRRLGTSKRLERAVDTFGAELIHGHFVTEFTPALAAARALDLPAAVTVHGHDVTRGLSSSAEHRRARVLGEVDGVVAVSNFIASMAVEHGARPERVQVLPIGISVPPKAPERVDHNGVVLFVGRLSAKKGVFDLINAVDRLGPKVGKLVIVGDGPLRSEVERMAALSATTIEVKGALDPEGVRQQMALADVFCGPSQTAADGDSEGFGLVFLEAAAASLPVVAYNHGGVPEAVADGVTGLLCEEGSVSQLTEALEHALDPAIGRGLGHAGRERVIERFDIGSCTLALERYYESLAR